MTKIILTGRKTQNQKISLSLSLSLSQHAAAYSNHTSRFFSLFLAIYLNIDCGLITCRPKFFSPSTRPASILLCLRVLSENRNKELKQMVYKAYTSISHRLTAKMILISFTKAVLYAKQTEEFCSYKTIWAASWQNQQNDLCTQRKHRSAWSSAQSDQSLRCPHEESLGP